MPVKATMASFFGSLQWKQYQRVSRVHFSLDSSVVAIEYSVFVVCIMFALLLKL